MSGPPAQERGVFSRVQRYKRCRVVVVVDKCLSFYSRIGYILCLNEIDRACDTRNP